MEKEKKENRRSAAEELTRYLAPRMRTVAEARKHLEEKVYDESEIRETLQRFLDLKYLDDSDYVRAYCEYAFGKRRGSTRIRSELRNKGIESETIQNGINDYMYENRVDECALARLVAEKTLAGAERPLEQKAVARVARKLEQMGYGSSVIIRILEEIKE